MPLIKSKTKKAFESNVKAEMDAGKPMKQSLAIAYSTKRKAPKKKMSVGGEVQDDVNKVNERDPIDHDSESDSTQFGPSKERKGSGLPLSIKTQQAESVFETEDPHSEADAEHFSLGGRVEMLVDKALKMKMGDKEAEHFADGGDVDDYHSGDKIYNSLATKSQGKAPNMPSSGLTQKEDDLYQKALSDIPSEHHEASYYASPKSKPQGTPGMAYGGKIENMVNACIDKKMMAQGGMIPEKYRYHNDPKGQSATGPDDESNHMDDDILSQDDYMNENMDHEDSMEPNKKKKLMSSILAEVRKHNMGK